MQDSLRDILDLREIGGTPYRIRQAVRSGKHTSAFTGNQQERIHISAGLDRKVLYITTDKVKAREAYERFCDFSSAVGLLTERDDLLMYRKISSHIDMANRTETLYGLASGRLDIVVATGEAVLQYLPRPEAVLSSVIKVSVGMTLDKRELASRLADNGYNRVDAVEEKGDFSVSGDILSLYPENGSLPVTVSFFDDEVESIKSYDISTRKSVDKLDYIEIASTLDPIFNGVDIPELLAKCKKSIKGYTDGQADRIREIMTAIQSAYDSGAKSGYNWLLPFCQDRMALIDAYLPKDSVIVFDDPKSVYDHVKLYYNDFVNRCSALISEGEVTPQHKQGLIQIEWLTALADKFTALGFSNVMSSNPIYAPMATFSMSNPPIRAYHANFQALFTDARNFNLSGYRVILCAGDEYTARSIVSSLYENNIYATYTEEISADRTGVQVTPFTLSYGFNYRDSKLVVIGRYELVRRREQKAPSRKKTKNVFTMPKVGDYVVHEVHGIGICSGVEQVTAFGSKKDFVVISYAEGDKLYIPVDQMDKLQRYSGSDTIPKLHRLGGKEFQKIKEKVKASVREMAFDLLELYKARQNSKGYKYPPDTVWQQEFEDAFEYEETDDQLRAIDDIKSDMERGIVMDRLLCGDVGYGKTEVALRAVFKTVMAGKQCAILAPTTILARQHYNTATERFAESGIKCALLSRFQSKQEIAASIEGIKNGDISVVIATHRLLSDDIVYKDLGLLVLDEEQRFGVEHKEKLKAVKNNINVLTLSATPIPRTLNMALTGIRDISVLETPPKERIPVETYVTELTDGLLSDVISRELDRDGQVYVLYNRVNGIEKMAERISALVPEAKVVIGHGQMGDTQLENAIDSFYSKESNVLVCTTIIENGINLPDANTLIVCDADRLGLSALYQLRGRVGRSNKHAYAYFTTKQGKALTADACKRLTAIMDYTDFGSGFKIAMRDLEIRGAGNVLGKEQHGHIAKVGYDMYCRLLQEAVDEISGNDVIRSNDVDMDIDIEAYLDSEYIPNNDEKIKVYKDIAELASVSELEDMIIDLTDRYGAPNESLINLMRVAVIKNMAGRIGAKKVRVKHNGMGIVFGVEVFRNERIMGAVSDMQDECVLSVSDTPTIVFDTKALTAAEKLLLIVKFLKKCIE